jgi:hypothetical protein
VHAASDARDSGIRLRARHASSVQPELPQSSSFEPARSREVLQTESLVWVTRVELEPRGLLDRVNPAAVALAMLAGFGFAVGVGSYWLL